MNNENEKRSSTILGARLQQPVLAGEEELQGLRHGVVEPPAGSIHELGVESEHEHAELHLAERAISVEVPLAILQRSSSDMAPRPSSAALSGRGRRR